MGRTLIVVLTIVIATVFTGAPLSTGQDLKIPAPLKPYTRSRYETLSGTITFAGKRPKPRSLDLAADPACYKVFPDPKTEYAVGNKGRLANVIVYVESDSLQGYAFERPASPAVLEHKGCRYVPHVL